MRQSTSSVRWICSTRNCRSSLAAQDGRGHSCPGQRDLATSSVRARGEVTLLKQDAVMAHMAGDDEGQSRRRNLFLAGSPPPLPSGGIEGADQRDGSFANNRKLVQQVLEGSRREFAGLNVSILLETGERGLIAARDAQQTVGKDTLGVAQVADDLLDGPFARGVAKIGLLVGKRRQEAHQIFALALQ